MHKGIADMLEKSLNVTLPFPKFNTFQPYEEICSLLLAMQLLQYNQVLEFFDPETTLISECSIPQRSSVAKV